MDEGDILLFLGGENEIERACAELRKETEGLEVIPLYSALPRDQHARAFALLQVSAVAL